VAVPAALRHRVFRRIWLAGLVSSTGDWMQIIGRGFLVYRLTGSARDLGLIYFASYIPQLLVTPFGGVFADKHDRKRTLVYGQVAQTVLAVLLGLLAATGRETVATIALISLAAGTVQTLTMPASMSLVPSLVPREALPSALSLGMTSNNATRFLGPLVAGVLIKGPGVEWVFYVNALTFVTVLGVWLATRVAARPAPIESTTLSAMAAGWRHVRGTPALLLPVGLVAVLSAVGLAYQVLGVAYATDVLAGGEADLGGRYYGDLQAAVGIGGILGIAASARVARRHPSAVLFASAAGFSLSVAALGRVHTAPVALALCVVVGALHFANSNLVLTLVQHGAPEALRGRVMSILLVAWIGLFPVTSLGIGWVAGRIGVPATISWSGLVCLVASVYALRWRGVVRPVDHADDVHRSPAGTREEGPAMSGLALPDTTV
jgi:predicted MFS family arabinose efflux permease